MRLALIVLIAGFSGSVQAQSAIDGTWAPDQHQCKKPIDGTMTIKGSKYIGHEEVCEISSRKSSGNNVVIDMKCSGEGEEWSKKIKISVISRDTIRTDSGKFVRCLSAPKHY